MNIERYFSWYHQSYLKVRNVVLLQNLNIAKSAVDGAEDTVSVDL